jgi:Flp pilus assembly protein TadB
MRVSSSIGTVLGDVAVATALTMLVVAFVFILRWLFLCRHSRAVLKRISATRTEQVASRIQGRSLIEPFATRFATTRWGVRLQEYAVRNHPGVSFSEVCTLALIGLCGGFLLGSLLFGVSVPSLIAALGGPIAIDLLAQRRHGKRTSRMEQQLPDALALQASALRAGRSLIHSLRTVEGAGKAPLSEEVEQLIRRVDLGIRFEDALGAMASRVSSKDVDLWVTAMLLHRSSGGDLTSVLDSLAGRLRERCNARSEILSLTAQGRMSGLVVALAPIAFFFFLSVTSREQMKVLYSTPTGLMLLMVGLVMEALGFLWIKWIVRVKL